MSEYKYPYISDKKMYAAVMGACSYIRSSGYFNKAVKYYADKFDVDPDELARHIRERQKAGQKGKMGGRKYKWFIVCEAVWCEADGVKDYYEPQVVRGVSKKTVNSRYSENDQERTRRGDYGGSYVPIYEHHVLAEFDTQEEAKKALDGWKVLVRRIDPYSFLGEDI